MYNQVTNWTQQQRNGPDETSRANYYQQQQQIRHQQQVVHTGTIASSGVSNDMVKTSYVPQAGGGGGLQGTQQQPQPTIVQFQTQQVLTRQQPGANPSPAPQQQQQPQQFYRGGPSPQQRQMQNLSQARPTLNHISMIQPGTSPSQQGYYTHPGPMYMSAAHPSQAMMQNAAAAAAAAQQPQILYQTHPQMHSSVEFQPSSLTTQHSSARYNLENGGDMNSAGMQTYRYQAHYQNPQNQQQILYQQQQQQQQQYSPMYLYTVPVAQSGRPPNVHMMSNMQPAQPQPPKREKKILQISDPNTLKDVSLEELVGAKGSGTQTPPMSGASSARDTPPMNPTPPPPASEMSDIAAQFARQVAAAASSDAPAVVPPPQQQTNTKEQLSAPISVTQPQLPIEVSDSTVVSNTEVKSEWTGEEATQSSAPITIVTKPVVTAEAPVCQLPVNVPAKAVSVPTEKVVVKAAQPPLIATKPVVDLPLNVSNVGFLGYSGPMVDVAEPNRVSFMPIQALPHHPPPPPVSVLSHPRSAPNSQDIVKHGGPPPMMVSPKGSRSESSAPPPPFPPQKSEPLPPAVTSTTPNESAFPTVTSVGAATAAAIPQIVTVGQVPLLPCPTSATSQVVASFTVQSQIVAPNLVQTQPPLVTSTPPHPEVPPVQPLIAKPPPHSQSQQKVVISQPAVAVQPSQPSVAQAKQNGEMPVNTNTSDEVEGRDYETKDSKKQKGKKKSRELNKKGETKEGGDMDAFLDKEANSVSKVPSSASSTVAQVPSREVETPSAEIVVEEELVTDDGKAASAAAAAAAVVAAAAAAAAAAEELRNKEEQRKVVEKNEENAKVSANLVQKNEIPDVIACDDDAATLKNVAPSLKFEYKDDQWSPVNPEGKKQYDRSFLLQLQQEPMSQRKPDGLPDLEVIKDVMGGYNMGSKSRDFTRMGSGNIPPMMSGVPLKTRGGNNFNDFTPTFFSQTTSRPLMRGRSSQQGRKELQPKKINITLSLNQDVKLHEADNAWKPTRKNDKELDPEEEKTEKLYKTFRGILNKLTPQNFPVLLEQVSTFPIDNELRLSGVIDLVFEKAICEPSFSVPYANMCKTLGLLKVPLKQTTETDVTYVNFRKLIVTRCQKEFEKDTNDEVMRDKRLKQIKHAKSEEQKKILMEELDENERKSKLRSLGNIRFIGELYKLRMLTVGIMHDCLQKLLNAGDEDSLECLCKLLTTIGKELDSPQQSNNRHNDRDHRMNNYFLKLRDVVRKQQQLSSRVRFMLQDVMDLRENNWVPRREDNNPKTIDQIHQEVAKEDFERQVFLNTPMSMQKRMDDRDRDRQDRRGGGGGVGGGGVGNGGGRRGVMDNDGWNTVPNSKRTTPVDPNKTKISNVVVDEDNLQLGPKGPFGWGRGSSGGMRGVSQEQEKAFAPQNRFSALSGDGSHPPTPMNTDMSRSSSRSIGGGGGGGFPNSRDSSKSRGSSQLPPPAQRGGNTSSRSGIGPSRSREMDRAVSQVKNFSRSSQSRDSSSNRVVVEKVQPTPVEPVQVQQEFDQGALEKKAKTIVDELIQNVDYKDAIESVSELCTANTVQYFVTEAINLTVERSSTARQTVGQLFSELVKREVMTVDRFSNGLAAILEVAEDYAIDIPKFWEYLAELLSPIVQDGRFSLRKLKDCSPLNNDLIGQLLGNVLQKLVACMDKAKVKDLWNNSGLQLSDVANDHEKFISQFKLDFLVKEDNSDISSSNTRLLKDDELRKGLDVQLSNLQSSNEAVFDWVSAHVPESERSKPPFIRALVTAIAESAIKSKPNQTCLDEQAFSSRSNLIKRYVDRTDALEMESLYALQLLTHRLQHPPKLLHQIFHVLYDKEVISEEAFLQWKCLDTPSKMEGHAVAVKSVNAFLEFVSSQNHEEEDDEAAVV